MSALGILTLLVCGQAPNVPLEPIGRLAHPPIREASGLVRSRRHPGVFWVHNDSGNPPALFAVRRDGTLVREYAVGVPNIDWEDIAADDRGHLYLGEIGNNDGRLPLRAVYQIDEPDPFRDGERVLKVNTASYYRFPAGGRFDAEGLVINGDRALVIAKTFDGRDAEVWAVPLRPPAPLIRPAMPERVGTLPGFQAAVTGADLTPDGRRIVVCSVGSVGVFEKQDGGRWRAIGLRSFRPDDGIEAVAWDGDDLVLAAENRHLFRIPRAAWRSPRPAGPQR
jgi:hypothetical protein